MLHVAVGWQVLQCRRCDSCTDNDVSSLCCMRGMSHYVQEGGMFANGAPWPFSNKPPVVVLADKEKAHMDESVHEMLRSAAVQHAVHKL